MEVSNDFLIGRILANDLVDDETGEIVLPLNTTIDEENISTLLSKAKGKFETLISTILTAVHIFLLHYQLTQLKPSWKLKEIYKMMRPGEPPTKESAQNLFSNLFFIKERYDLSDVGRMKFNARIGDDSSKENILNKNDIVNVILELVNIRNGNGEVDDIDHLGNRRKVCW